MRKLLILLAGALILTGCGDDQIKTYRIPKEPKAALPMPMGDMAKNTAPFGGRRDILWTVPNGWVEQAVSSMRVGSFLIKGDNGQTADVSVVPLSGEAGGTLANINRWRGQIQLPPISDADLTRESQRLTLNGRRMLAVNFVSGQPLIDNRHKKRILAAIYPRGGRTWFFKMTGEDATVLSAEPAFLEFLRRLRFRDEAD